MIAVSHSVRNTHGGVGRQGVCVTKVGTPRRTRIEATRSRGLNHGTPEIPSAAYRPQSRYPGNEVTDVSHSSPFVSFATFVFHSSSHPPSARVEARTQRSRREKESSPPRLSQPACISGVSRTKWKTEDSASDILTTRVSYSHTRDLLIPLPCIFRVFRSFRGWNPVCVVPDTVTDEREAHTSYVSGQFIWHGS